MAKTTPINPPAATGAGRQELPAYVSNGLIGLRVRDVPLTTGMTLVSGYSGEHYERQIEAAAVAPYPIAGDIALNGAWLSDALHQVRDLQQTYDFSAGELTSRFTFQVEGVTAQVEVLTFCSRADPTLVCQEVSVVMDKACSLGVRAVVDATGADGRGLRHSRVTPGEPETTIDGSLLWESAGGLSTCGVAFVTQLLGAGDQLPRRPPLRDQRLVTEYGFRARAGMHGLSCDRAVFSRSRNVALSAGGGRSSFWWANVRNWRVVAGREAAPLAAIRARPVRASRKVERGSHVAIGFNRWRYPAGLNRRLTRSPAGFPRLPAFLRRPR